MRPTTAVTALLCCTLVACGTAKPYRVAPEDAVALKIGDGSNWRFLGGEWTDGDDGVILPTPQRNVHSRAFYTANAYADVTVEFEYWGGYRESATGTAGLILRAQDGGHFYWIHFPWTGQPYRAKGYWAGLGIVSGDGYVRHAKFDIVPGVPAEWQRWYAVKVEAVGTRIRIWVDGRLALDLNDDTHSSGYVGLAGWAEYRFRNVRVTGKPGAAPPWDDSVRIRKSMVELPVPSSMPTGCVAPNGDVLLGSGMTLLRSTDKGRTWSKEQLPEHVYPLGDMGATLFRTAKGRLIVHGAIGGYVTKAESKAHGFYMSESFDSGKTWSEMTLCPLQSDAEWPPSLDKERLWVYGPLTETEDGTLIRFLYCGVDDSGPYNDVNTWAAVRAKSMAFRSTDGGKTWAGPIELDRPTYYTTPRGSIPGALDFTETTGVAIGNTVMTLIRPIYSPWMWQCWSHDAGVTWDAAARATFHGAAQSLIRTHSGYIVCGHRHPGYALNVSRDNGLNWDAGTIIDWPTWAMGCMIEVEPDVLLVTYNNMDYGNVANLRNVEISPLLAQRVRITPTGIEPAD